MTVQETYLAQIIEELRQLTLELAAQNEVMRQSLTQANTMQNSFLVGLQIQRASLQMTMVANPELEPHIRGLVQAIDAGMGITTISLDEAEALKTGEDSTNPPISLELFAANDDSLGRFQGETKESIFDNIFGEGHWETTEYNEALGSGGLVERGSVNYTFIIRS